MMENVSVNRLRVFDALHREREYQDDKWGKHPTAIASYILYMQHHLDQARKLASTGFEDGGTATLDQLRKVTALGVACMEAHGAPTRAEEFMRSRP